MRCHACGKELVKGAARSAICFCGFPFEVSRVIVCDSDDCEAKLRLSGTQLKEILNAQTKIVPAQPEEQTGSGEPHSTSEPSDVAAEEARGPCAGQAGSSENAGDSV